MRSVIESNTNPTYDKAQALRLYVEQSKMDTLLGEDMDRYRAALVKTGGTVDDIEPIQRFHEVFEGPVDVAYAAAVVGLETEAFQEKIRENIGLQNAGLLVLDNANGSVKRDAWTSSFGDIVFALDFPERFTPPTVITPPEQLPGTVVHIPDPNLRAAIAEALGKSPNAPITVEEMERLRELRARYRGIRDLTGLQFATNLNDLFLRGNHVSDLSPIAGLTNLTDLEVDHTLVSDISPVRGLTNLTDLEVDHTLVSDISPVRGLTNLTYLRFNDTHVSDLSPIAGLINLKGLGVDNTNVRDLSLIAGLINLEWLSFSGRSISDLTPLAGLINLNRVHQWNNPISDLSPLAGLTKLEKIDFCNGNISDLTPLAGLTGLKELYLATNKISDISPLAGLTGLTRMHLAENNILDVSPLAGLTNLKWLHLEGNDISDISLLAGLTQLEWLNLAHNDISNISPLAGLTHLEWLNIGRNKISDLSPLDGLRENIKLSWFGNPAFPKGGPKIEGPWLWVVLPNTRLNNDTDLLAEASGGTVTEVGVATHGATAGKSVGDSVWTSHKLPPSGHNNIEAMLKRKIPNAVIYGSVSLHSPRRQETTMYVGSLRAKAWLNGTLIHQYRNQTGTDDYTNFYPVTLKQGRNVLLVAAGTLDNGYFGFEPGTQYTVSMGVGYIFSQTPIHIGDTFTLDIRAEDITDLAGWQFDITFDLAILEAINVSEGDFLKTDGGTTFFQGGSIDNASGKITGLSAARLSTQGVSGTGVLLQVRFKAKSAGETELTLDKFQFGSVTGDSIPAGPHEIRITVEERLTTGDVNRDGVVSILDLILVAQQLGRRVSPDSAVDVNGDGVVSILDLIRVAQGIAGSPTAPAAGTGSVDAAMIEAWIAEARLADDGSLAFKQGIENLEALLHSLIPEETALLANYPNPFNPETWIPYQLAESAEVTLTIYDINGQLVRRLEVGASGSGYISESNSCSLLGRTEPAWRICRQRSLFLHTDGRRVHGNAEDADSEINSSRHPPYTVTS